jgi:NADH-quinone oxidoreductase subunit E
MDVEITKVDSIVEMYGQGNQGLIPTLLEIQNEYHYLPPEALKRVAERMSIPMIRVYQVASFYKAFSLKPRGKHIITVCLGTACHVRGGEFIVDQIGRLLGIKPGENSADMQFTLEAVNCLGCCSLGPVMVIDNKYYGNMAVNKVERVLKNYKELEVVADD